MAVPNAHRLAPLWCAAFLLAATVAGCGPSTASMVLDEGSAVRLRSMETRAYDTTDREAALRTAMGTLQDLGFAIDQASYELGTITATKAVDYGILRMTVSVRPRGTTQLLVRASADLRNRMVDDPEFYQRFFAAYSKAMFLDAHLAD